MTRQDILLSDNYQVNLTTLIILDAEEENLEGFNGMAISPSGGVFSYLLHHLDLVSKDSVGHSTCMSVLARRRAIMGSIVQPKRSCLGAATGTAESPHRWGK